MWVNSFFLICMSIKDLDVTGSDIAMGLALLRWQSLQWIGGCSRVPAENVLKQTDPVTTDLAAPVRHYTCVF